MRILRYGEHIDFYPQYTQRELEKYTQSELATVYTFGMEIETDAYETHESLEEIADIVEEFQQARFSIMPCKDSNNQKTRMFNYTHDGSITGIEFVTQPMSFDYFLEHKEDFHAFLKLLTEHGMTAHNGGNCGLHFHVNHGYLQANKLGNDQANLDVLIATAKNMKAVSYTFKDEFKKFSRRNESQSHWCEYDNRLDTNILKKVTDKNTTDSEKNSYKHSGHRYKAVNICNSTTIECRMMRGTLKWETFYLTVNFIHNFAMACCKDGYVGFRSLVYQKLDSEMKTYADKYLAERKIEITDKVVRTYGSQSYKKALKEMQLKQLMGDNQTCVL